MNSSSFVGGLVLIVIGTLFLAESLDWIYLDWVYLFSRLADLWPLIIIGIASLAILRWFRNRRETGQLFVGVMFMVYGLTFLYSNFYGWWRWGPDLRIRRPTRFDHHC